jgi:hypothetical protein
MLAVASVMVVVGECGVDCEARGRDPHDECDNRPRGNGHRTCVCTWLTTKEFAPVSRHMGRTEYTVGPKSGNRSGWKVEANGIKQSDHRKKKNALAQAKSYADTGDVISVQNRNGQFQRRIRG